MAQIFAASRQWATRPNDERYLSLEDLQAATRNRRETSVEIDAPLRSLPLKSDGDVDGNLYLNGQTGAHADLTHYSFGQLATRVGAPAGYLRSLPTLLAHNNLMWGLAHTPDTLDQQTRVLISRNGEAHVRAFTSTSYGRIWDEQVVGAIMQANEDGRWVVPAASYAASDPLRATTLYASDHDVFAFLVDPEHPIDGGPKDGPLYRGFIAWNSETGARTFGLMTFLYQRVCDNRIIWGASEINEVLIRHTGGGPGRFAEQAVPALKAYSDGTTRGIEEGIKQAKERQLAPTVAETQKYLEQQGFTKTAAKIGIALAEQDGRDPTNAWDAVWGLTRAAQSITHTDDRLDAEKKASKLLALR